MLYKIIVGLTFALLFLSTPAFAAAPSSDINFSIVVNPTNTIVAGTTNEFVMDLSENTTKQGLGGIDDFGNYTFVNSLSDIAVTSAVSTSPTNLIVYVTYQQDISDSTNINLVLSDVELGQDAVKTLDVDNYKGQKSVKVNNKISEYYFHKLGGGLASIIDKSGKDWISYNTSSGSAGEYRGIPNFVYPDDYFHPGRENNLSQTLVDLNNYALIESVSNDNKWMARFHFFPNYLKITMEKSDPAKKYWFLYEGTPGGSLEANQDYYVLPDGSKSNLSNSFTQDINTNPEWIYFGDPNNGEEIVLINDTNDNHVDSFYQMQNNMTVFGFGRTGTNKFLDSQNKTFYVIMKDKSTHQDVGKLVASVVSVPEITIESGLSNPTPTATLDVTPSLEPSPIDPKFDLDDDGIVDIRDVLEMIKYLFK